MATILRYPFSAWQKILEHRYRGQNSCGSVLMFHEVYAERETPHDPQNALSLERFTELLDRLSLMKRFVRLDSYETVLAMREDGVALTFDDIYENAYQNALPLLRNRSIPYTVFIATGLVGTEGYLSRGELDALRSDPLCTIGAHSVTHGLSRCAPGQMLREARESAGALSARLYAFPYGSVYAVSRRNCADLEANGVADCAFSTLDCDLTEENKHLRYFLPRRAVSDGRYDRLLTALVSQRN